MRLFHCKPKVLSHIRFTRYMAISHAIKAEFQKRMAVNIIKGYTLSFVILFLYILLKG